MRLNIQTADQLIIPKQESAWGSLFHGLDALAQELGKQLTERAARGQFFTPTNTARFMASLFSQRPAALHILDAGAGLGALSAALVAAACEWAEPPQQIHLTAYENDPFLLPYLNSTLSELGARVAQRQIAFQFQIIQDDFIQSAVEIVRGQVLLQPHFGSHNAAILNPPYRKIQNLSKTRRALQRAHIETTNLYAAFVWLATLLLQAQGELVAITPRSFCNGPYFRPFRKYLLGHLSLQRIHVFDVRQELFKRDDVLQENIILHGIKRPQDETVLISTSAGGGTISLPNAASPRHNSFGPTIPKRSFESFPMN